MKILLVLISVLTSWICLEERSAGHKLKWCQGRGGGLIPNHLHPCSSQSIYRLTWSHNDKKPSDTWNINIPFIDIFNFQPVYDSLSMYFRIQSENCCFQFNFPNPYNGEFSSDIVKHWEGNWQRVWRRVWGPEYRGIRCCRSKLYTELVDVLYYKRKNPKRVWRKYR